MSTITRKPKPGRGPSHQPKRTKSKPSFLKAWRRLQKDHLAAENEEAEQQVKLRLPVSLLQKIDACVKSQRIKTSRHRWLMEAIIEKLEKASY